MAPIVVPHVLQKALLEKAEERHVAGLPPGPIHATLAAGNSTQVSVSAPECLRQMAQEQVWGFSGVPAADGATEAAALKDPGFHRPLRRGAASADLIRRRNSRPQASLPARSLSGSTARQNGVTGSTPACRRR